MKTFAFHHFQHVGIPVTNLSVSAAFYKKLGFTNVMQSSFDFNEETGIVAMMQKEAMIVEIYQLPEKELAAVRSRKAGNIDHIAFDVDDIDKAFEELTNEGFRIVEASPVFLPFWQNGCRYFNVLGPDGERLEFNQIL